MLWQSNTPLSPQPNEGTALPATFGDTFDTTWREGLFFSSSIAQLNARTAGLDNYLDEVQQTTGKDIRDEVHSSFDAQQAARDAVAKLKQGRPDLQIPDLTDEELDRRAASISGLSHQAFTEMAGREKTWGGTLGMLAGGLVGGVGDPLNLVAAPAAVEAKLGILGSAALWGGFGAGSQAVNEITGAQFREQASPGYTQSGAPAENILEAGLGGAALGGLFKGLGNVWTRMKTGEWPRSVRDAGNIVESEANVQSSNVLPGVEGDAAHREALGKAIDDIAAGRPVEAPESASNVARQQSEIMDARDAAMEPALPSPPPPTIPTASLEESAKAEGFNTTNEFWHGTTLGKFTEFRESKLENDVLGPANYLSTKAGAEFYGPGRGGDLLGPFWVKGEIANPNTLVPYALSGPMAGKMAPAINALERLKMELDTGHREPWGKDLSPQKYANEFWKRRGFAGYDSGAGLEVAVYDPKNIRAGFSIEKEMRPVAVPERVGGLMDERARAAPIKAEDTRGNGIQYHGTSATDLNPTLSQYSSLNYYGQGFYTTDAKDIAYGYSKRGSNATGERNIYQADEKAPVQLLDMESPITNKLRDLLVPEETTDGSGLQLPQSQRDIILEAFDTKPKNTRELYDTIREIGTSDYSLTANNIQEIFDGIRGRLEGAGYGGLKHVGGSLTEKAPHQVKIYFNPERDIKVARLEDADTGSKPLIGYHGTNAEFERFDINHNLEGYGGTYGYGHSIAVDEDYAKAFGKNVYKVEVAPGPIVDLMRPFGEQEIAVQDALKEAFPNEKLTRNSQIDDLATSKDAARKLSNLGVRGLSYEEISGSKNYTIFNDKDLSIIGKNGQAAPAPLLHTEQKPTVVPPSEPPQGSLLPRAVAEQLTPEAMRQTLADPAHATGMMADLERMRDTGSKPQMVAIGTDATGEPQYQLLDAAIQEAKDYENAASQLESCINPPAEEAAE